MLVAISCILSGCVIITDEEMEERKKTMQIREQRNLTGYLRKYAKLVHSADTGAIVE